MKNVDELNSQFDEFAGGTGRLLTFGGLQTLTVEVEKDERLFTVRFGECYYLACPVFWENVNMHCSTIGENLLIEDEAQGIRIVCHLVQCTEFEDEDDA